MREFLYHIPCPKCKSKDNAALYSDGYQKCFSCDYYRYEKEGEAMVTPIKPEKGTAPMIEDGEAGALKGRRISEKTCSIWKYHTGTDPKSGETVHIANYCDARGNIVAQKIRTKDKKFRWLGSPKEAVLYGQNLWRDGGKRLVITEGELDALSVSEVQDNKWPVISVPNGAKAAAADIKKHLEWLEKFDEVVFLFDGDKPGREAAQECAALLSPGRGKVGQLPLKDASDMLQAGRREELVNALWGAKSFRPDGILTGQELWERVSNRKKVQSLPYPWESFESMTHGLRPGEIVTLTAGTGMGKSQVCREIAYDLVVNHSQKVGYIALEESVEHSTLQFLGIHLDRRLHLLDPSPELLEEMHTAFDAVIGEDKICLYDHWGSIDVDTILAKIRYLVTGVGCNWVVLDHLSILVSGTETNDERKLLDTAMTKLRSLVEELKFGLLLVNHLKRPEGKKSHEDGLEVSLGHLRGSGGIAQVSDMVIAFERNQQDGQDAPTRVRLLKNRFSGDTGVVGWLRFSRETGRLYQSEPPQSDEGDSSFGGGEDY